MRQSGTRPVEELTPERLATNFTNYSKELRGIRAIRGQAFSEFVATCGGGTNRVGFPCGVRDPLARVSRYGENSDSLTVLCSCAERSAAKMTRWLSKAVSKLVNGMERP